MSDEQPDAEVQDNIEVITQEPEPQTPTLGDEPKDETEEPEAEPQPEQVEDVPEATEPDPAEPTEPEGEGEPEAETQDTEPEIDPAIQAKIDKLEKQTGYLQRKLNEKDKKDPEPEPEKPKAVPDFKTPKPAEDDFEAYDDYVEALTDWKVDKKLAEQEAQAKADANDVKEKELVEEFTDRMKVGETKYKDFKETITDETLPITHGMVNLLRDPEIAENPADVAYYLGKNRAECSQIAHMTPPQAAVALNKISAKLAVEEAADPTPKIEPKTEPNVSKAPAPIVPIGSKETVTKDPTKMTQKEYEIMRRKQKKAAGMY